MRERNPANEKLPQLDIVQRAVEGLAAEGGRLGALGGAFNPVTRAHLVLAREAAACFRLQEVVLVLPQIPPHKPVSGATLEQRLEMMQIAAAGLPFVSVALCSHGLFLDIATALRKVYPENSELFFLTGRDAAERILSWPYKDPAAALRQMFSSFQLLVFDREGGFALPENRLVQQYAGCIHSLQLPADIQHISSSRVRERVRAGDSITDLVPRKVAAYIAKHNLYKERL